MTNTSTIDQANLILKENPTLMQKFALIGGSAKTVARGKLMAKSFCIGVIDLLLPLQKIGRKAYTGRFALLCKPGRDILETIVGDLANTIWTSENASKCADALVEHYKSNVSSAAITLKNFRNGLFQELNIEPNDKTNEVIASTYRTEITKAHNALAAPRLAERAAEGIQVPECYKVINDLKMRAIAFIKEPVATAQAAADLLVILSARPGESETLNVGNFGHVTGCLKKRDTDMNKQYALVSVIGVETASSYLTAWKELDGTDRRKAMKELPKLASSWNLQSRDLRAIGASMAVLHETLEGNILNITQARTVHAEALRHEPAVQVAAQVHYERVNNPLEQMYAQISQLSTGDIDVIKALIASRTAAPAAAIAVC
jgi:hypothetical protein